MAGFDSSSFMVFILVVAIVYALLGSVYLIRKALSVLLWDPLPGVRARSKQEAPKVGRLRQDKRSIKSVCTTWFIIHAVLVPVAIVAAVYLGGQVSATATQEFDPYALLELSMGATEKEVKSAYRRLSLIYHPDKNPSEEAQLKFLDITKAMKVLTDAGARENYEKYGHPDGPQGVEHGMGLPSMQDKSRQNVYLVMYAYGVVMVMVLLYIWHRYSQKTKLSPETQQRWFMGCQRDMVLSKWPEIYASAEEFLKAPPQHDEETKKQLDRTVRALASFQPPKLVTNTIHPTLVPAYNHVLNVLHAHMNRSELIGPQDVALMMEDRFLDTLIPVSIRKDGVATGVLLAVEFQQLLVQALADAQQAALQLPYGDLLNAKRGKSQFSLADFVALSPAERASRLEKAGLTDEQRAEVENVVQSMPHIKASCDVEVVGHPDIHAGDICTCNIRLVRLNLLKDGQRVEDLVEQKKANKQAPGSHKHGEQEESGPVAENVYAPFFPTLRQEKWWIALIDGGKFRASRGARAKRKDDRTPTRMRLVNLDRITKQGVYVDAELKFQAPEEPGTYWYQVRIMSDSYVGLDIDTEVEFTVLPKKEAGAAAGAADDLDADAAPKSAKAGKAAGKAAAKAVAKTDKKKAKPAADEQGTGLSDDEDDGPADGDDHDGHDHDHDDDHKHEADEDPSFESDSD